MIDLDKLERLARAEQDAVQVEVARLASWGLVDVGAEPWLRRLEQIAYFDSTEESEFLRAVSPSVVLDLIAKARRT